MVGIIIATHYTLAESLKETSSMIIGERENVVALSRLKEDNM
jgi:mannose/fructose-specific phosphotransferase system component IIA